MIPQVRQRVSVDEAIWVRMFLGKNFVAKKILAAYIFNLF